MKAASISVVVFALAFFSPLISKAQFNSMPRTQPVNGTSILASDNHSRVPMPTDEGQATSITAPNAIYLEVLGSGFIYSINYDRTLMNIFSMRIGFGYFPFPPVTQTNADGVTSTVNASLTSVPISLSWFPFGATSSKLEIGAGATYIDLVARKVGKSATGSGTNISGILGYRYQPSDGGFLFKIAFTPIFSSPIFSKFQPWGGLTLGYAF
jgi:hypothetical protein